MKWSLYIVWRNEKSSGGNFFLNQLFAIEIVGKREIRPTCMPARSVFKHMIILLGCTLINLEISSCVTFKVVLSSSEFKYFSFTTLLCWQPTMVPQWSQHMNPACDDIWKACFIYKHSCRQMKADRCKSGVASSPQALSGCTFSSVSKAGSFFFRGGIKTFCHIHTAATVLPFQSSEV